jgi:hypothetical protein
MVDVPAAIHHGGGFVDGESQRYWANLGIKASIPSHPHFPPHILGNFNVICHNGDIILKCIAVSNEGQLMSRKLSRINH